MSGVDRISQLADEIINHILSFLPTTKLRARTSLLSKRWRHIWTHHPSLHFSLPNPSPDFNLPGHDADVWAATVVEYACAVSSCFRSSTAPVLQQFSVDLWLPRHPTPTERLLHFVADLWLLSASLRSVGQLRLQARTDSSRYNGEDPTIPASLFRCRLVTDLEVLSGAFPNIPSDFHTHGFPFLKALTLERASVSNHALNDLLAGCPHLSSLSLLGCSGLTDINVNINAPTLTDFVLFVDEDSTAVSIDPPNLRSITYRGDLQLLDLKGSPVFLREAALCWNYAHKLGTKAAFMRVLLAISAANVLTANDWFYEFAITETADALKNLKELDLYFGNEITKSELEALIANIGRCWNLEKLGINLNFAQLKYGDLDLHPDLDIKKILEEDRCDPPENLGQQSLWNLKTVTVRDFLEFKSIMWLATFLLGSAVALERFVVFDFLKRDEAELHEMFAPIPKASPQLVLKLSLLENKSAQRGSYGKHPEIFSFMDRP